MGVGVHLYQLHAAATGATLKTAINAAVTAGNAITSTSFPQVVTVTGEPYNPTKRLKAPVIRVTVESVGREELALRGAAGTVVTNETIRVAWTVEIDGTEAEALFYEGILAQAIRNAQATMTSAVTSGRLDKWAVIEGRSGPDEDKENADAWQATVVAEAWIEW